jgi:hypothetical protein
MNIKNPISKVMIATVAAGAVALGAVGVSTASADSGYGGYIPNMGQVPQPVPPVVQPLPYNPYWNVNVRYNQPYLVNGRWVYPYQPYANPLYVNAAYVYPVQYYQAAVTATQFSFITASASVLNMNRGDVVLGLQQGKSLTQIAAERGIQRVTLQNAVINTMRGSINVAVASGALSPVTGNALQSNLNARAGTVIDQPGTVNGTNAGAIETAYQLFKEASAIGHQPTAKP